MLRTRNHYVGSLTLFTVKYITLTHAMSTITLSHSSLLVSLVSIIVALFSLLLLFLVQFVSCKRDRE